MAHPFVLGWEEWLALPELGVPGVKAKIDTGARTSALHAFTIAVIGSADQPRVRFGIHPIPGRDDVAVMAEADVVDRREVTSSNGEREWRWVIRTPVRMGERTWPVEITLTNRETMAYRMLLGRQALQSDMLVDATTSFRQPRLSYELYGPPMPDTDERASLSIGLVTRRPENPTNRRFVRTAEDRGHTVAIIDRTRVSLWVETRAPALFVDGHALDGLDAVLIRGGRTASAFTLAMARQLDLLGSYCVPRAASLALLGDPLALRQALAASHVPIPEAAISHTDFTKSGRGDPPVLVDNLSEFRAGALVRFAVIGGRALAAMERDGMTALGEEPPWRAAEMGPPLREAKAIAETAAQALDVAMAAIDIASTRQGHLVVDVSAGLAIAEFERLTGVALSDALVAHIEQAVRARAGRG